MSNKENEDTCETKANTQRELFRKSLSVGIVKKETINTELSQMQKANETTVRTDFFGNIISKDKKNHKVTFSDQVSKKELVETINISDKMCINDDGIEKRQTFSSQGFFPGGLRGLHNEQTEKTVEAPESNECKYVIKRRHRKTPIIKEEKNEDEENQTCACFIF